jgi:hypothetical protein
MPDHKSDVILNKSTGIVLSKRWFEKSAKII